MKERGRILAVVAVVAGVALFFSAAWAQKVVRIVRTSGNDAYSNAPASKPATDPNAVQPIDPTPDEHSRIADLIEQLGDERLVRRDQAMSELAGYEARALGQVRESRSHDDDEIAHRCSLLEEVILSRQGELFLAARQLNLTIPELNAYLQAEDVKPLLSILRSRAQPGLVALWARVLARLAGRTQLFPTAELCREIEGDIGFGLALCRAARTPEAAASARALLLLMIIMPPGDPADTVETMTQLRFSMGGGRGIEEVMSASTDFRGIYTPDQLLAAREGRPDPLAKDPEGAAEVRLALTLSMLDRCSEAQLALAELPALESMSPLLLSTWLGVLQRSGLGARIENAMLGLLAAGADTRRVSITAGAYAAVAKVSDVLDVFDTLPFEAQLNVLDAIWLNPREPRLLQPFLVKLLAHARPGIRAAAALSLGQYRAASTAAALLQTALADAQTAPAALQSLLRMAELLAEKQLGELAAALPAAGLLTRPLIAEILARSGVEHGLKPLVDGWRLELPRNELTLAVKVLAVSPQTPAGAFAAARIGDFAGSNGDLETYLLNVLDNGDLEFIRTLLAMSDEEGFALLHVIAVDENDASRLDAMKTLAMAGRDGELVQDWLKRMAGEIKDPLGTRVGEALAFSLTPEAEEFKRNTLQQGATAAAIGFVLRSVIAGRCNSVSRDELLNVLFETPESARQWQGYWTLVQGPMPDKAATNLATALAFAQGQGLFAQPGVALMLADAKVDLLKVMYGDSEKPTPRDLSQLFATVVLCDATRARTIVEGTQRNEDGSNYVGLLVSRAWLGMLSPAESARLRSGVSGNPANLFGAVSRRQRAAQGDTGALRVLLDAYGPDAVRFQRGETASMQLMDQRWGSPQMDSQGVASAIHTPASTPGLMGAAALAPLFSEQPPAAWRDWWACRRALLEFDATSGKYRFLELP